MTLIERASAAVDRLVRGILVVTLSAMFVVVLGNAALRYIARTGFIGGYDAARVLFLWSVFLGITVAFRRGSHSKFVFLIDLLSPKVKRILRVFTQLLAMALFAVVIHAGIRLFGAVRVQRLPASGISAAWLYAPIIVNGVISELHLLNLTLTDIFSHSDTAPAKTEARPPEGSI